MKRYYIIHRRLTDYEVRQEERRRRRNTALVSAFVLFVLAAVAWKVFG